jgi:hypothetical protein
MFQKKTKVTVDDKKMLERAIPTSEILNAVVIMHPSVKRIKHPKHGFCLRWSNQEKRTHKERWWNFFMPSLRKRSHILILDEVGRRTVELFDGEKDLNKIAYILAGEFHFDEEEAKAAIIAFTMMLRKKNIIQVEEK